jgi:hypothetical protein
MMMTRELFQHFSPQTFHHLRHCLSAAYHNNFSGLSRGASRFSLFTRCHRFRFNEPRLIIPDVDAKSNFVHVLSAVESENFGALMCAKTFNEVECGR